MSKKILFSPIGGNDPVSSTTERDGSMLHICRVYKPDIVYLYLSKEMYERHEKDNRYGYCIEQLGKLLNHHFEVKYIFRKDLVEVQEYDFYYTEFEQIIKEIRETMEQDDELLFNIASGSPAMKSCLLLFAALYSNLKPIQVTTPAKRINSSNGEDEDYDPEYYWEINRDNETDFVNRAKEIHWPNLNVVLKKDIILKHIKVYDYNAALLLAEEIRDDVSDEFYDMLQLAVARIQLDLSTVTSISKKYNIDVLPVKSSDQSAIFEYSLALQIKLFKKEYGDFVRAISPLITDLFEMILKYQCKIDIRKYCVKRKGVYFISRTELDKTNEGKEIIAILDEEFNYGGFRDCPIAASNLKPILLHYIDEPRIKKDIEYMREVEENVRNMAAHEIVSITEEKLQKILGNNITFNQIFKAIKSLVVYAGIKITSDDWNSYDDMNGVLENMLR